MSFYPQSSAGVQNPTFTVFEANSYNGVGLLNPSLTINSITNTPLCRYNALDVSTGEDWSKWIYGEDLHFTNNGNNTEDHKGSPCFGPLDDSILFRGGDYYASDTNTENDITTQDFVLEVVFCPTYSLAETVAIKQGATNGYKLSWSGSVLQLIINDGSGNATVSSATLTPGCWYHCIFFMDRSGNGQCFTNGAAGSTVDISGKALTLTNTGLFQVGAGAAGAPTATPFTGYIAYLAMWYGAAWLDTATQTDVALTRFNKLTGIYPQVAAGTTKNPTSQSRATPGYITKTESGAKKLYRVGAGWMRVDNEDLMGFRCEEAKTNVLLWSNCYQNSGSWATFNIDSFGTQLCVDGDMEGADTSAWTALNSATLTKETTTPHGGSRCLRVAYNGSNTPGAYQTITAGKRYVLTGWCRGDGTFAPRLGIGTNTDFIGTNSTSWQPFCVKKLATIGSLVFSSSATSAGYCEFDDITCYELDAEGPDKIKNATPIIANSTLGYHSVGQTLALTAAVYTFSTYVKAGDKTFVMLELGSTPYQAVFNLTTGTVDAITSEADEHALIENLGGGWFRCSLMGTGDVGSAAHSIYPMISSSDGAFAGDGSTVDLYIFGSQIEQSVIPTSYVPTTTAAAQRNADILIYKGDDGNLGGVGSDLTGSVSLDMITQNHTPDLNRICYRLTDGGGVIDYISQYCSTSDRLTGISAASGGSAGGASFTTDPTDGVIHKIGMFWATNNMYAVLDGVYSSVDSAVDIPDDLDAIHIGHGNGSNQLNGIVGNFKVYKKIIKK